MTRRRLTMLDATFLQVETATAHMHTAWKGRFAPPADGLPVTLDALRALIAGRIAQAPRFRQRLAFPPLGLAAPVWADDERFDLERHVVALGTLSRPISPTRFHALVDRALSEPLDRSRPLWQLHLAPRLTDGTIGILMRTHHAMVDGVSALEVGLLLLDTRPDAQPDAGANGWLAEPLPSDARLTVDALLDRGREPLRMAGELARLALAPARLRAALRGAALSLSEDLLRPAPSSHLNGPISARRTLVGHTVALEALRTVGRDAGVTLNDVALAAIAGALRRLALARGAAPGPLKTMVPVSLREPEDMEELGNRVSFVFIDLPVGLATPKERLDAVHAATQRFKHDGRAAASESILNSASALPTQAQGAFARFAASSRTYNLTASNIPGPDFPVYMLGAELIEAFPVIPIADDHALSIGVFSYDGHACFGFYADPDALPEASGLPEMLDEALDELTARVGLRV